MRRDTAAEQKVKERSQDALYLTEKWPEEKRVKEERHERGERGSGVEIKMKVA